MMKTIGLFLSILVMSVTAPQVWAATACTVEYSVASQSAGSFKANVSIVNQRKDLKSWRVDWKMLNGQRITQLNGGTFKQKKAAVRVKSLPNTGAVTVGGTIAFDFEASSSGNNSEPEKILLNGAKCEIQIVQVPTPTPSPSSVASCEVNYQVTNQWDNGFTTSVQIKNNGPAWAGWELAWSMPGNQKITDLWNGHFSQSGNRVAVANETWNGQVGSGDIVDFGFNGSYSGSNALPGEFSVKGVKCTLADSGQSTPTATPTTLPTLTPTPTSAPTTTALPTLTPTPTTTALPTLTPTPTSTPKPTSSPTPVPSANCEVNYQISAQWDTGFTAAVKIRNNATAITSWKLAWDMPNNQKITNLWNGQYTQNGAHVEVANAGWNGQIAAGGRVEFGFNGNYSITNPIPGTISLNGGICTLTSTGGGTGTPLPNTVTPNVPSGFTANVVDNSVVSLSWNDQSSNESGFSIERRYKGDAAWSVLSKTAANAQTYADSTTMMGADYEYRLSAFNAVGSSSSLVLPVSIPSLLDYGKWQYQHQNCGSCHGTDGNGGIAGALTQHLPSELSILTASIAATMPTPGQCIGNCALGTARYILEVLVPANGNGGNNGGGTGTACSGNPPGHRSLRLLTRQEYQNTVNDLLGLSTNLIYQLPDENRVDGFDNNAATNLVTNIRLEAYLSQADTLANQAVLHSWSKLLPCSQQTTACAQQFIDSFGKRAYRRPLTAAESADYLGNFSKSSFNDAVTTTITQMLMSPYFLYRSELGDLQADGSYKLTPYETATALSYLFLGSLPDDSLFAAADQNQLERPEQRLKQAARLIGMSKSRQQVGNFVGQWLLSSSPYTLPEKDKTVYPRYTADVKAALSAELIDFFNYVTFDSSQSFPELFTANYVVANKPLLDYYGIAASGNVGSQATPVADGSRTGIMTLGAVLSRYANSNESHPFKRGGFLYKRLLCHDLPLPANAGLVKAPLPDPTATTRERFDFHSKSNASCFGCHQFLDPPGFGFENYDGAGIYRIEENGQNIATGGIMLGMESFTAGEQTPFADLRDLSGQIANSPQAAQCVARQYFRYTTGRREQAADSCALDSFIQTYANNGYNLQTMLLGIVNAPGFNLRSGSGESITPSSANHN